VTGPVGERERLRRRGFWLEYASIAWMVAEATVGIAAGVLARSIALIGFGLDSVIEIAAALVVIWQLRGEALGSDRDTVAVRFIAVTFFALAAYLTTESVRGLAVAAAALLVMPALALAKRRTGQALGSRTLIADSYQTAFCACTSAAALLGAGLNTWAGWWQADPIAGLVIAALAIKEGIEAWHED
jgi:divalent metal cation (Fe/Co/Zn/Cd) transporter